jgi:hypothetical protein
MQTPRLDLKGTYLKIGMQRSETRDRQGRQKFHLCNSVAPGHASDGVIKLKNIPTDAPDLIRLRADNERGSDATRCVSAATVIVGAGAAARERRK